MREIVLPPYRDCTPKGSTSCDLSLRINYIVFFVSSGCLINNPHDLHVLDDLSVSFVTFVSSSNLSLTGMLLQLAKKFHPDTNKDDSGAEKKFQEVNRAYEV